MSDSGTTALVAEALARPSGATSLERREARARMAAARRGRVAARDALRAAIARAPLERMNPGAANALARSIAADATAARLRVFDRGREKLEEAARSMFVAAREEAAARLGVPTAPSESELAAADKVAKRRLDAARRAVPKAERALRARVAAALMGPDPKRDVAAALRSPLDAERIARLPASDVVPSARSLGVTAAGRAAGIEAYRFVAVLDARTSVACRSAHGRSFEAGDVEGRGPTPVSDPGASAPSGALVPPLHVNCRSRLEPVRSRR